jgi:hypothetical protein
LAPIAVLEKSRVAGAAPAGAAAPRNTPVRKSLPFWSLMPEIEPTALSWVAAELEPLGPFGDAVSVMELSH